MNNDAVRTTLAHLVGTVYTSHTKATISALTGRLRVVGPGEISTREFDPQRIHIQADDQGRILGFVFA
ncbi:MULTISPECIES: I78 family peptidase inhibitor [unclassified Pseudomonas]|uniref:I78 family peptidase inhibitor n=1 Tax=unclassified Pseudomonas TaxID=196821 RepID=UPI000BD6E07C|nr:MULTISPECIES: I78 family peptidase inhibitor [unclassified Pseudomonas]PVZ15330.1 peptidase inhibitor I78 family protein [Pseudomonas sp. URIL14HWK12:I12]PVZ24704.1 peptidase inhibitor I78 family protein [Pseudomonas sp. URIL14HWK12:I10]PVZ34549.1 peptidase inhibitor I78 family protein [Pseudomonas sp. URIL14HWK12:I11]SNZ08622.1 Peptidase inhibitor I78 family protein [Pseudomonas sp. URIL14HWK12:I9]